MLENITLGQYYPAQSVVHALDPRVKILLLVAYIVAVFLVPDLTGFLIVVLFLLLSCRLSKLPFRLLIRGMYVFNKDPKIRLMLEEPHIPDDILRKLKVPRSIKQCALGAFF